MKLETFKEKNKKKIGIILFTITCIMLISGVILYRTFAVFETSDHFNMINGEIEEVGDIYFAFYKDGVIQKEMPQKEEGYRLDEENSYCGVLGKKDESIKPTLDRDTWSIVVTGMKTSRTKCNLYFIKTYDENTLFDLSGNHYDGTFIDGAKVQEDEEGNLGIYFDGTDDYVDVTDLPASINWEDGFTIEATDRWESIGTYSRIFDFGNGACQDNIVLCNSISDPIFLTGMHYMNDWNGRNEFITTKTIELNKKNNYKIKFLRVDKGMVEIFYDNNKFLSSHTFIDDTFVRNVLRQENFLGKSNWIGNSYFKGYIYSLKIIDSNDQVIIWYDF